MNRILFTMIAMMFVFAILVASAQAEQGQWKEELERLCNYTEVSGTLSDEELRQLVKDSDILLEKLKALDESEVKVYIFRLKKCRNLYAYSIEVKEAQEKQKSD